MTKLTKQQSLVLGVIRRHPAAADSEMFLLERYWIEVDKWDETKSLYWNLQRSTHAETISRRRRELYNMGLIEYSDKALKSRTKAFKKERDVHSTYSKDMAEIVKPKIRFEMVDGEKVAVIE